jgi:predicted DNA-binding WGR domain protein
VCEAARPIIHHGKPCGLTRTLRRLKEFSNFSVTTSLAGKSLRANPGGTAARLARPRRFCYTSGASAQTPLEAEAAMSVQLALFPEVVVLTRVRPERNERRFYRLEIRPDLFGRTMLIRRWGRIGTPGRQRLDPHPDAGSALNALAEFARNKRRRGYRELPAA